MDTALTAQKVLDSVGGRHNVIGNSICMTRLRLTLRDASLVDADAISSLHGVLGIARRGDNGVEVVFGPAVIVDVSREFSLLTGIAMGTGTRCVTATSGSSFFHPSSPLRVEISPGQKRSYSMQGAARASGAMAADDIDALRRMLDEGTAASSDEQRVGPDATTSEPEGPRLLVLNGPNINMLGIREPDVYGREDFASLVALCKTTAQESGFSEVRCYQSNHEGDLVDEIQAAWRRYDGIVINPGAYTHTSIALLDALKAVSVPAVEVHISKVDEREDFRQVSYVRAACFETICGMGIEGYRKAIRDLATRLATDERD